MCAVQSLLVIALVVGLSYSWEIALTTGDRIEFYTNDGIRTETVRFPSRKLSALAYDEVHNTLLYVDKQSDNDAICGYNMTSVEYQCYVGRSRRNIQGLAFDPVTELLFFTDTRERSINWFSFKPGARNHIYGNLLIKMDDGIPTDLAVDSCRGYIYWINTNLTTSTIERARCDGSAREVVIEATNGRDLHSLAIDQQTNRMCWGVPEGHLKRNVYCADLNGNNKQLFRRFISVSGRNWTYSNPNSYTVSKKFLYAASICLSCKTKKVWKYYVPHLVLSGDNPIFKVLNAETISGIAANYKMKEQFRGISDCNHVFNNYEIDDTLKVAKEYEGQFCVHGVKETGQSVCKCSPGYFGERCERYFCENYCFQGNCSISRFGGLPSCRCYEGYSGDRCEVNLCNNYCLNSGTCSLNEEDEPVCECTGQYEGGRCELPVHLNTDDGSPNETEKI
ncbi:hypothetical protein PYW07_011422 [Mythimna separata]|uniref:Protein cueball n=1 Tax=Mythimna separata TaxID=271217 RepID=A0AAD8DLZ3_MYTSE|nr:hypothetical protein PYW07_011422 [Mythimna separata]